jgi:hypothetical protein
MVAPIYFFQRRKSSTPLGKFYSFLLPLRFLGGGSDNAYLVTENLRDLETSKPPSNFSRVRGSGKELIAEGNLNPSPAAGPF